MMDKLFLTILNMSLTGAFVIAVVCLARVPLKKAPKIISYCLWAVAGFRLVFPFAIESAFSLIPFQARPIPLDIGMQSTPHIGSIILPPAAPAASVNPLQIWTAIGASVWLIGIAAMLLYGAVTYLLLKRSMGNAKLTDGNLYEADNIQSPFVLGFFQPRIYLPLGLPEQEKSYIILHERTHIRRYDHIIKCAAYFVLCLHWFNPLVWVAFFMMGTDMELSCDERVLKDMGGAIKKNYSLSLLSFATQRRVVGGSPLAFGEGGIQERVKNVLNFKQPSRIIVTLAVVLLVVLSVGFSMSRAVDTPPSEDDLIPVVGVPMGGLDDEYGTLIEDDKAIHVMGRKAVHLTLENYDAWVAAGEHDADVYDYAECVLYTPVGNDQMYMTVDDYRAWAAAGENEADIAEFAVPFYGQ